MSVEHLPSTRQQDENVRPLDPNVKQWRASDPQSSVWVSASAGTGKTKVLTDRVLRLLLPRKDGSLGTPAHKILCLTYTKAAANEMSLRISRELSEWVIEDEERLIDRLKRLSGEFPTEDMLRSARRLFAQVADTPGGLKIMTIHAFCQSILSRFPLEAEISAHMDVMDDFTSDDILMAALEQIAEVTRDQDTAYSRLLTDFSETALLGLIKSILMSREELEDFFQDNSTGAIEEKLRTGYNAPDKKIPDLLFDFSGTRDEAALRNFAAALERGSRTDRTRAQNLYEWLSFSAEEKMQHFSVYKSVFLNAKGEPKAKPSKGAQEVSPDVERLLDRFCEELLHLDDQIKAVTQVQKTLDLLTLGFEVLKLYDAEKDRRNVLDYNDLILKTLRLLKHGQKSVPWVLYKLDGGIDHLLVDEAQDTSPAQWEIIRLLCEEFFSGESANDRNRTLFVVGDEKQSIYRFQGAALEQFQYMREYLGLQANSAGKPWLNEALQISFRSTRSVLKFVDACFAGSDMKQDIGVPEQDILRHDAWRNRQAGRVELWPLVIPEEKRERQAWEVPIEIKDVKSPQSSLAENIATEIQKWLQTKEILESKNRPIEPQDILILLRSRGSFANQLIRALKLKNIPVSGADRLILTDHIAVQDLLSLLKFALFPEDDLSLAEILKSPFIGMSEEELFEIAHNRNGSLWTAVQEKEGKEIFWLKELISSRSKRPYDFFINILHNACPADLVSGLRALRSRLGDDCLDPLGEFLNSTLQYEIEGLANLQTFLVAQQNRDIEIKREMEEGTGAVRIMTAHGAKGLQAPIVFLPDTLQTVTAVSQKVPRLIWPRRSEEEIPVWSPRKVEDCAAYTKVLQKIERQEIAEYKRLFYVAATRAEDRLIICGAQKHVQAHEESWYYYAENAFDHMAEDIEEEDGRRILSHPQIGEPEKDKHKLSRIDSQDFSIPDWAFSSAPTEPVPSKPLQPSRPSGDDVPVASPRDQSNAYRFRRGNVTHTLLQFLPDLSVEMRKEAGQRYLEGHAQDLPEGIREDILREVLNVMQDSDFSDIFGSGSQAEVPITGMLSNGQLVSGQIDRLIVKEEEVLIIDYKSNRPAPRDPADISSQYQNQMRTYSEVLSAIYPSRKIRTALLWTESCQLMEV